MSLNTDATFGEDLENANFEVSVSEDPFTKNGIKINIVCKKNEIDKKKFDFESELLTIIVEENPITKDIRYVEKRIKLIERRNKTKSILEELQENKNQRDKRNKVVKQQKYVITKIYEKINEKGDEIISTLKTRLRSKKDLEKMNRSYSSLLSQQDSFELEDEEKNIKLSIQQKKSDFGILLDKDTHTKNMADTNIDKVIKTIVDTSKEISKEKLSFKYLYNENIYHNLINYDRKKIIKILCIKSISIFFKLFFSDV